MDLFVYGSLKRGFSNHHFLDGAVFLGPAVTLTKGRMVDCGGYPGIVPATAEDGYGIQGEVWRVTPECLEGIDWLEDLDTGVYVRTEWPVRLEENDRTRELNALIYLFNQDATGMTDTGPFWPRERDTGEPIPHPHRKDQQ